MDEWNYDVKGRPFSLPTFSLFTKRNCSILFTHTKQGFCVTLVDQLPLPSFSFIPRNKSFLLKYDSPFSNGICQFLKNNIAI